MSNKGSTLIEALFAFSIYTTILVVFVSSINILNKSYLRLEKKREENQKIEIEISKGNHLSSQIEKVLH